MEDTDRQRAFPNSTATSVWGWSCCLSVALPSKSWHCSILCTLWPLNPCLTYWPRQSLSSPVRILCKPILCVIPKKGTNLRLSWRSEGLRGKWKLVTGCDFASSAATPCLGRRVLIRDLLRPKEPRTTITQDTTSVIFIALHASYWLVDATLLKSTLYRY